MAALALARPGGGARAGIPDPPESHLSRSSPTLQVQTVSVAAPGLERPARGAGRAGLAAVGVLLATMAACASRPARPSSPAPGPALAVRAVSPVGYHDETSVAIDPTRPGTVLAAYQVPATVARSTDGGEHWSSRALPETDRYQLSGDPAVTFDAQGHAYALYIAFDRPDDYDTLGAAAHRNGIFLNRSDDGGRTWWPHPVAVIRQREAPGIPFEDKPMMTTDPGRPGSVYVAWTEFRRHESVILFARSRDGGRSFSRPLEISGRPGSPKDSVGADEGTDLAVGPDGTLYVVWSDSTGIRLDRSTDGGASFGPDILVATTPDIVFGVPGVERANGYPSLEVDRRTGRLYVAWVDGRLGHTAVLLSTSDDGGAHWSPPRPIDGSSPGPGADRFFAWISADPVTGLLAAGYYRRLESGRLVYELAWSRDGGARFQRRTWSAGSFEPGGQFLGDYTGVAAYGGRVFAAWTEAPPGEIDVGGAMAVHTHVVVGRASFTPATSR